MYYTNQFNGIDMNLKICKKFYIICLFVENKAINYTDCIAIFKDNFKNNKFILTETIINKIKSNIKENYNNYNIEKLCKSIKLINNNYIIDIFPIKSDIII